MTQQEQMKLVLLYSLYELNGGGQRKQVLQYINDHNYWYKNDQNDTKRSTRNENTWRNDFSFERQHLVEHGYMEKNGNGKWKITINGKLHIATLIQKTKNLKSDSICFTPIFYQKLYVEHNIDEASEDQVLMEQLSEIDNVAPSTSPKLIDAPQPKGPISHFSGNRIIYLRDPAVAKRALSQAGHLCQIDSTHISFIRRNGNTLYMEPHHLIPMSLTDYFGVNLDREQNIFSLCSTCHNQIHYGKKENVRQMVSKLFLSKKCEICSILGRDISLHELFHIYNVL